MSGAPLRIAVLASGEGTTLQAVIDACERRALNARVVVVIGNNSGSGAKRRADAHAIPFLHLSRMTHPDPADLDAAIRDTLAAHEPDVVLLAGYMKKLGAKTLEQFGGRVINTHPSLLPRHGGQGMYGSRVHAAVLASGDTQTGISVHFVDEDYDTGAVLAQRPVAVLAGDDADSLAERVQASERRFLIEVLGRIAAGDITLPASRSGL
jgi:phosphoribosylglycinamide formyltransferase-1